MTNLKIIILIWYIIFFYRKCSKRLNKQKLTPNHMFRDQIYKYLTSKLYITIKYFDIVTQKMLELT